MAVVSEMMVKKVVSVMVLCMMMGMSTMTGVEGEEEPPKLAESIFACGANGKWRRKTV